MMIAFLLRSYRPISLQQRMLVDALPGFVGESLETGRVARKEVV